MLTRQRPHIPRTPISPYLRQRPSTAVAQRPFSIWRIPIYLATAGKTKRRIALLGTVSGITLLGAFLGPTFWIISGGAATLVSWRIWRQTSRWWQLINQNNIARVAFQEAPGLFRLLEKQVGSHRAIEQVRQQAIERIYEWAQASDGKRVLLDDFGVDHVKDITFFPVHASSSVSRVLEVNGHRESAQEINVEFWAADDTSKGPRGGSCYIHANAIVDSHGNIELRSIRLNAPGWHSDEYVPLQTQRRGRVIEGEYRDL